MWHQLQAISLIVVPALALNAQPTIVAHRGASKAAPENTIPAFLEAWKQNADAIEGDFHITRDGIIVCIHDKDTEATASVKKVIKDVAYDDLKDLDVGQWHDPKWKGTKIPTLAEVLAIVPRGKRILIEVKCGPEIVPALLTEMKSGGLRAEQMIVISFDADVIGALKSRSPKTKAFWLSSFEKLGPLNPSLKKVLSTLKSCRADGFSSKADPRVTKEFVQGIQSAGYEYHVWTIDEAADAKRFAGLGVQSITTNRPQFIRRSLEK